MKRSIDSLNYKHQHTIRMLWIAVSGLRHIKINQWSSNIKKICFDHDNTEERDLQLDKYMNFCLLMGYVYWKTTSIHAHFLKFLILQKQWDHKMRKRNQECKNRIVSHIKWFLIFKHTKSFHFSIQCKIKDLNNGHPLWSCLPEIAYHNHHIHLSDFISNQSPLFFKQIPSFRNLQLSSIYPDTHWRIPSFSMTYDQS